MKAIVLDVDDTTLATWNYEISSNWAFNPATNGHVRDRPDASRRCRAWSRMANAGRRRGLRDLLPHRPRPATQEAATLGNLTADGIGVDAGYPRADDADRRRGRPLHEAARSPTTRPT